MQISDNATEQAGSDKGKEVKPVTKDWYSNTFVCFVKDYLMMKIS